MSILKGHPKLSNAWEAYRIIALSPNASPAQIEDTRIAFWAGASTLFYAIITGMDEGSEPTSQDMRRMDAIHNEIEAFTKGFDLLILDRLAKRNIKHD